MRMESLLKQLCEMKRVFKILCLIVSLSIGSFGVGWSELDYDKYSYLLKRVNKGIIKDYVEINKFWKNYEGKIEEVSKKSYDLYLKQNNIQSGIKNYNESISLILKYKFQENE